MGEMRANLNRAHKDNRIVRRFYGKEIASVQSMG